MDCSGTSIFRNIESETKQQSSHLPPGSGIVLAMIAGGMFWGVVLTLAAMVWR